MKNIVKRYGMAILAILLVASCKKEVKNINLNLNPVGTLNLPENQVAIKLTPSADDASVLFKWAATTAEDGDPVLYEVAFDKEGGDFSKPVFRLVSDGGGVQTQVTVSHKILTKVAAMAGIEASSTGKIKWAVLASKVANVKVSAEARTMQLERPAGFAELPAALYLTGSATEGGDDVTKALSLKKLEEGIFEIYTSLKAGSYKLTDKNAAGGKEFYLDGSAIKEGANGVTVSGDAKVYRITLDFNLASVATKQVGEIGLYMSAYNTEIGMLTYQGNGLWRSGIIPVEFYQFSWGRDERYKFKVHSPAGDEWMGSSNVDNSSPAGKPASYFYLLPKDNNQWNNTYKFDPSADKHNVRVEVSLKTDGAYTHQVTVIN